MMTPTDQPTNRLTDRPTDQPNNREDKYIAICLFEGWKIEGRDLQLFSFSCLCAAIHDTKWWLWLALGEGGVS